MAAKNGSMKTCAKKNCADSSSRVTGTIERALAAKAGSKSGAKQMSFSFYAPAAKSVAVAGTFNNWNTAAGLMKKSADGTWKGSLAIAPGRYEYRYCVDGRWENEQKPCELVANNFGSCNCVLVVS